MDEGLTLGHSYDLSQHVCQPDGVDKVEVVETSQVIIVVQENPVVMEELGSYKERKEERAGEERERGVREGRRSSYSEYK